MILTTGQMEKLRLREVKSLAPGHLRTGTLSRGGVCHRAMGAKKRLGRRDEGGQPAPPSFLLVIWPAPSSLSLIPDSLSSQRHFLWTHKSSLSDWFSPMREAKLAPFYRETGAQK